MARFFVALLAAAAALNGVFAVEDVEARQDGVTRTRTLTRPSGTFSIPTKLPTIRPTITRTHPHPSSPPPRPTRSSRSTRSRSTRTRLTGRPSGTRGPHDDDIEKRQEAPSSRPPRPTFTGPRPSGTRPTGPPTTRTGRPSTSIRPTSTRTGRPTTTRAPPTTHKPTSTRTRPTGHPTHTRNPTPTGKPGDSGVKLCLEKIDDLKDVLECIYQWLGGKPGRDD